ncbi:transporter [Dactylosporangium darangshiense]|uniref:Transporter n=2 Tax=Dactylosporangium darangshiense TaxID=579108 RepID=A0ABP8DB71_9ACTN
MKLAVLRHATTGQRAADMIGGAVLGVVLAGGTIWLALHDWPDPELHMDLIGAAFAIWVVGWLFGPVLFGGGDETLRPEHLALLPISPRKLTFGLLSVAFVGVAPAVSLIAFAALIVAAVPLGAAATVVAVVAVPLQLVFVVVVSRLVTAALGTLMRTKLGAGLAAIISGGILALTHTGWVLKPVIQLALQGGFPDNISTWVHALPSGWGVSAVEAAQRGDWLVVAGALLGLAVISVLSMLGWSALLVQRLNHRSANGRPARAAVAATPVRAGAVRAVVGRDLRTTSRDLMRFHYLCFAQVYALVFCLLPLVVHLPIFVPFIGVVFVIWAAAVSANLYGEDGTALWLTILSPKSAYSEVRGRQLAWLLITAPVVVVGTVVPTVLSGQGWAWPWVASLAPALLGGGAGVIVLISVLRPVPMTDPHKRSGNLLENGTDFTQVLLMLILVAATAAPAYLTLRYGSPWTAVPVGVVSGSVLYWLLGHLAGKRLEATGPAMLEQMRAGVVRRQQKNIDWSSLNASMDGVDLGEEKLGIAGASPARRATVYLCLSLGWVPLVAQGMVPAFLKLTDPGHTSWFLALHLPGPLQWPMIAVMVLLGLAILLYGRQQLARARLETAAMAARAAARPKAGTTTR